MTLRLKVEIVPFGNEAHTRNIMTVTAKNRGPSDMMLHKYEVDVETDGVMHPKSMSFMTYHNRTHGASKLIEDIMGHITSVGMLSK